MPAPDSNARLERATQAVDQSPDDPHLRRHLGWLLAKAGQPGEAISQYESAARLYVNKGAFPEAAATCRRLLALNPAHAEAQRIVAELEAQGLIASPDATLPRASGPADSYAPAEDHGSASTAATARQGYDTLRGLGRPPAAVAEPAEPPPEQAPADRWATVDGEEGLYALLPPGVATSGIQQNIAEGAAIVEQGEHSDELFLLLEGRARAYWRAREQDQEIPLEEIEEGSFFGEIALLGDGRRFATVRAAAPCTVLMIPRSQVIRLMRQSKSANRMIRAAFRDRLQAAIQRTCPLLTALDPDEAENVLQQLRPLRAKPGQPLVTQGEFADGLYLVLLGELQLSSEGQERQILQHGDFFGPGLSVMRQRPSQVTITSRTFVQLLRLPADRFAGLAEQYPELLELLGS